MHVRVCRECGEEYRPEIAVCADCGGELEDRHGDAHPGPSPQRRAAAEAPDGDEDGEPEEALCLAGHPSHLTAPADELVKAGLPFRLAAKRVAAGEAPSAKGFELLVPLSAVEEARRILAPLREDAERLYVWLAPPAHLSEDEIADHRHSSCPACDTPVAASDLECPACGLALGQGEGEGEVD